MTRDLVTFRPANVRGHRDYNVSSDGLACLALAHAKGNLTVEVSYSHGDHRVDVIADPNECRGQQLADRAAFIARETRHTPDYHVARARNEALCRWQQRHGTDHPNWTLGTNIYGWAAGSSLLSNLRGGSFSCIVRGSTWSDAVVWACTRPTGWANLSLTQIPEGLLKQILVGKAAEKAGELLASIDSPSERACAHYAQLVTALITEAA